MGILSTTSAEAPAAPAQAVSELHARLADVGAHRIYSSSLGRVAVLSLRRGLTVWCWGGLFRWREGDGTQFTHAVTDPEGAAHRLVPAEASKSAPQVSAAAEKRQGPAAARPYAAGVAA